MSFNRYSKRLKVSIPFSGKYELIKSGCCTVGGGTESLKNAVVDNVNSNLYPRKCSVCFKIYKSKQSFSLHKCISSVSDFSLKCNTCLRLYKSKASLNNHKKSCKGSKKLYPRKCDICSKIYNSRQSYSNHKKTCSKPYVQTFQKSCKKCSLSFNHPRSFFRHSSQCSEYNCPQFDCIFECPKSYTRFTSLIKHLLIDHKVDFIKSFTFDSFSHFQNWLEFEASSTYSFFKKCTGTKSGKSNKYYYYSCQFDKHHTKFIPVTSRKNNKGTIPKTVNCPVKIYVSEKQGVINVTYFSKHNHSLKFESCKHQPLKQSLRNLIKAHLRLSVPITKIKEILQDGAGMRENRDSFYCKEFFISNKEISAYKRYMLKALQPDNDAVSISSLVESLKKENYDPILIYKPQGLKTLCGPTDLDVSPNSNKLFALGIQTLEQKNMMIKGCQEILCIDSTHKTNQYDFYLINLIVPDEFGCGYPVAHFITNFIDIETVTCLFRSIQWRIPELYVSCLMTDDDNVLFSSFERVFGSNIKHLLCLWHVRQSWVRQLHNKVKEKELQEDIYSKLMEMKKEKIKDKFHSLLNNFIKTYSTKCSAFIDYFHAYYYNRVELWSIAYRNFPHAYTDTNMYCESFHNKLKTGYFNRKFNKRLDKLVLTLLDIECNIYLRHKYKLLMGYPFKSISFCADSHKKGLKVPDSCILRLSTSSWLIASQSKRSHSYTVKKIRQKCSFDLCFYKCVQQSCKNLCNHLYSCSCQNSSVLCKHIHKVHSYSNRNVDLEDKIFDFDTEFEKHNDVDINVKPKPIKFYKPHTTQDRMQSCKDLVSELLVLMEDPKVQSTMLRNIHTTLNSLVSECKGIAQCDNNEEIVTLATSIVSSTQNIIPQPKLIRTSKKRKTFDFCDVNKPISKQRKLNNSQNELIYCENHSEESFTFPLNKFKSISDPMLHIGNYKINVTALKSLDPFLSVSEENFIKSQSPDFTKGWLYDSIVNSYLFKLLQNRNDMVFVDSAVSLCIYNGICKELDLSCPISSIKYLFIPICIDCHWILLVANLKEQILLVYDSSSTIANNKYDCGLKNWTDLFQIILQKNNNWQIEYPPHSLQLDNSSCGVFVCFYAHQIVNNGSVTDPLSTVLFRKHIYNCLSNHFENYSFQESKKISFLDLKLKDYSTETMLSSYVKVNDIELTPYMLKSIDPFISDEEEKLMKTFSTVFKRGWLYDTIIDAFLLKILNDHSNYMSVSSLTSSAVWQSKTLNKNMLNNIISKEYLIIPCNLNSHWVLIIANLKECYFEFYDPLKLSITSSYSLMIQKWCIVFQNIFKSFDKWLIKCPPHILQSDNINCGVFVCYYAYQKINNLNLNHSFDILFFRKFIYECIVKNY